MPYHPKDDPDREILEIYKELVPNWDGNSPPQQWLFNRIKKEHAAGNVDAAWKTKAARDFTNWERSLPQESHRP